MISATPDRVRVDASALVIYRGAPHSTVQWSLSGSGTLTPIHTYTDANGQASARYTPGTAGDTVTISVVAGA